MEIKFEISWERMIRAVERVRERLFRATAAFDKAEILYAVAGGHAVAAWVSMADESAVRTTPDVDIILRREDFVADLETFLDHPDAKPRDAVHILFAREKVKPDHLLPTPDVSESYRGANFQVVDLQALVRMKLTSHRIKDRVHVRDMIDVGLVDTTWPTRFPELLGRRLQELLDTPDG
jgi:hypothetical protein